MVKLVDTPALGAGTARCGSSSLPLGTHGYISLLVVPRGVGACLPAGRFESPSGHSYSLRLDLTLLDKYDIINISSHTEREN